MVKINLSRLSICSCVCTNSYKLTGGLKSIFVYDFIFQIYSSGNPTNIANPIIDVSVKIDIKALGGRLTFFQTTACEKIPWKYLKAYNDVDPLDYLGAYNVDDIQLICCQPDASTMWLVPPPVQSRFVRSLEETEMFFGTMELILNWDFLRARPKGKELVKYESPVEQCPSVDDVKQVLNGSVHSFRIADAYPRYFRVTGSGEVRRLESSVRNISVAFWFLFTFPERKLNNFLFS